MRYQDARVVLRDADEGRRVRPGALLTFLARVEVDVPHRLAVERRVLYRDGREVLVREGARPTEDALTHDKTFFAYLARAIPIREIAPQEDDGRTPDEKRQSDTERA